MSPDIFLHADLPFPKLLPQFQRLFPPDAACATYLERIRWEHGFVCPYCGQAGEPFRFAAENAAVRAEGGRTVVNRVAVVEGSAAAIAAAVAKRATHYGLSGVKPSPSSEGSGDANG